MTCIYLSGIAADHHGYPPFVERVCLRAIDPFDTFDTIMESRRWLQHPESGTEGFARMAARPLHNTGGVTFEFTDPRTAFAFKMRWG